MSIDQPLPREWFDRLRTRMLEARDPPPEPPAGVRALPREFILRSVQRFAELVAAADVKRRPGEKLPRATELRPYRFCVQDVVLAVWAMAHRKDEADIFVDVFLASEAYDHATGERGFYDHLAGATAALLSILSEAYRVGAPLKVAFGPNVEAGRVPLDVLLLAARHGIPIADAPGGRISESEGRRLYLALTGFRAPIRDAILLLHQRGLMSPERAAYIVHHGVWSLPEVEGIILSSAYPDLVLSGDVHAEHRHLHQHVLAHSRIALLGGLLDRSLSHRGDAEGALVGKAPGLDAEDDERDLIIRTNPAALAREYELLPGNLADRLRLPDWECPSLELVPGQGLSVLLRPRNAPALDRRLESDLALAAQRLRTDPRPAAAGVAVPYDFHDLPHPRRRDLRRIAQDQNVLLLVCPETTRSLDQLAQRKMAASRIKKD